MLYIQCKVNFEENCLLKSCKIFAKSYKNIQGKVFKNFQGVLTCSKVSTERVMKIKSAMKNGLTLWLDQHSDRTSSGTIHDDYNGFKVYHINMYRYHSSFNLLLKVFIGQTSEFPVLRDKSLILEPGREHFVHMSGIRVSTDSSAAKLDVHYRFFFFAKIVIDYFLFQGMLL